MHRLLAALLLPALLALALPAQAPPTVGSVHLTPGYATFGYALPQGAAKDSLTLAGVPTQVDVKCRWPDNSVKFAVITAKIGVDGAYAIQPSAATSGAFPADAPALPGFWFVAHDLAEGRYYGVSYYGDFLESTWLDGPLCRERRVRLPLTNSNGDAHWYLAAVLDVRQYADGTARFDLTIENSYEGWGEASSYHAYAGIGNEIVWQRINVDHGWLCRWRQTFWTGPTPQSEVVHDFTPFVTAKAIPRYSPTINNEIDWWWEGPQFDILGPGLLNPSMPDAGGRAEIAPTFPDWGARYLVHRLPPQKETVLRHGDLSGSWPIHLKTFEGNPVSLDERPNYWQDPRAGDGPGGNWGAIGPLAPDLAHQPSLAFLPYLLTGDAYYADEMAAWSYYCLNATWPDYRAFATDASDGILWAGNQIRGGAWALRNLADAAAYLPDGDPRKVYLTAKLRNNLAWADHWAANNRTAYNVAWNTHGGNATPEGYGGPELFTIPWQHCFVAWAIHRANGHGFPQGAAWKNQIATFFSGWLNSTTPALNYGVEARECVNPYRLVMSAGPGKPWYTTFAQASGFYGPVDHASFYGPEARIATIVSGNAAARTWITNKITNRIKANAGWFIIP